MNILPVILLSVFSIYSAFSADSVEEARFVDAITTALKNQDREAFYKLVCFDKLDKDWIATNKEIFEVNFREAKSCSDLTGSISYGNSFAGPMPSQKYNCPVIGAYFMHIAPDTSMILPLSNNNGKLEIACIMPKK